MKRSTDRILTAHVGSLSRPDNLVTVLTAKDRGQPYDREAYTRLVRESVGDVVRRQTEIVELQWVQPDAHRVLAAENSDLANTGNAA